jgi:DNA-binding transcriptional MerR regulator
LLENYPPPHNGIPDKFYFKIGEVTAIAEVAAYVLRFWESEFAVISPKRTEAGQRLYRKSDVESILLIKHLLYDKKFTIQGARNYLKTVPKQKKESAASPPPTSIDEIRADLRKIRSLLD